jgi:hypothetical protein
MNRSSLFFTLLLLAMVLFVGYTVSCCLDQVVAATTFGGGW